MDQACVLTTIMSLSRPSMQSYGSKAVQGGEMYVRCRIAYSKQASSHDLKTYSYDVYFEQVASAHQAIRSRSDYASLLARRALPTLRHLPADSGLSSLHRKGSDSKVH